MSKRFLIIFGVIILAFFGLVLFSKKDETKQSGGDQSNQSAQLSNHTQGEGTTGVVLVEYGDFECPACYQYYPLVEAVKQKYGDQIKFQFRHYPLTEIHQNALIAARASEAADKQGKFWEMYAKLYEGQPNWKESSSPASVYETYAKELGMDVDKFKQDMKNESTNAIIQADRAEARKLGYSSTPTFEINGKKIENPRDVEGFSKLIDEAIKQKKGQ